MCYYYLFLKKYFIFLYEKLFLQDIDPALTSVIIWPNYMISEYHKQLILEKQQILHMQLVLRINKTSIRMNNWVIFFHFEIIGIELALKLSQMCGIRSTLNIYGKIFTWSIITLHKLVHWFPTSKIYTMHFLNLDGLGRYNDIIWTYACYNFRHCKVHTHIQAWIFWNAKTYTGEILLWCNIDGVLSEKPQNTHNLNCLFFNGCLGWKFKNCWNDWLYDTWH